MINLKKISTSHPKSIDKKTAEKKIEQFRKELFILQNKLYASKKKGLLIVLQGLDTSGKDGTISHVFSSINPQGCNVSSFKSPTEEEALHDFLWRIHSHVPERGMMGIFNRSYYEDILYTTVHKTFSNKVIERRYKLINNFEEELQDEDIIVLKFFLHISKKEQEKRITERLTDPHKRWKYNPNDQKEEHYYDEYMKVFGEIIDRCSPAIPWHVVPADHRWYRNYIVAKKLIETLDALKLEYPS